MPVKRKYTTKDGTVRERMYSQINGRRAESYRREQSRRYRAKMRQIRPARQRTYPVSQAETLPGATLTRIIDGHRAGESLYKLSSATGLSRYLLKKVIKKHVSDDAVKP